MRIAFVNPGTGPIEDASLEHAIENIKVFMADTGVKSFSRDQENDRDGLFGFKLYRRNKKGESVTVEVDMPGLPLDQVRYTGAPEQNIWNYPRLYIDCSAFTWLFAVGIVRERGDCEE